MTAMTTAADEWIQALALQPHPEGGFYRETYRAETLFGHRAASTAIYYLLQRGQCSRLHRIASDEIWHFYAGGPLVVVELTETGDVVETRLGANLVQGETLQHCVKAGRWFGAYCPDETPYALVGCTVSPGFDFADLEWGNREALLALYPQSKAIIEQLTVFSV